MGKRPFLIDKLFVAMQIGTMALFVVFALLIWRFSAMKQRAASLAVSVRSVLGGNNGCLPRERKDMLEKNVNVLKRQLDALNSRFSYIEDIDLSDVKSPGLYFMERLSGVKAKYEDYLKGLRVAENLGFPRQMPSAGDVPCLLKALRIEDNLLDIFMKDNELALSNISVEIGSGGDFPICAVRVGIIGEFERIFELLKQVVLSDASLNIRFVELVVTDEEPLTKAEFLFVPMRKDIWGKQVVNQGLDNEK